MTILGQEEIKKVAKLANLPIDPEQIDSLTKQFEETVDFVGRLKEVRVAGVPPTSQVTGLESVFREDEIDRTRSLTQDQALSGSAQSYKGFFVVPKIFD